MNITIFAFTTEFNPNYAMAVLDEVNHTFGSDVTYFARQWWGNSQISWIDPFLMMNMGSHL